MFTTKLIGINFLDILYVQVTVLEEKDVVGGACRTEYPFAKAPALGQSTGAYLLGVMPPEIPRLLDLDLPTLRRDPHYFLPTRGAKHLLLGSDRSLAQAQFERFFSPQDWEASLRLEAELSALRSDLGPCWLQPPLSAEETAQRHIRPALRDTFLDLVRQPISAYLGRFGFASPALPAMYAVTDAFSGLSGGWNSPGTGLNFLLHNMCRLPGSDGTWMVVRGGMGTVSQRLAARALETGRVRIATGAKVTRILTAGDAAGAGLGSVSGVELEGGERVRARAVVVNADPFRTQRLAGGSLGAEVDLLLQRAATCPGRTLKVNLALKGLPEFSCLPDPRHGQHRTTTHLLPDDGPDAIQALEAAHLQAVKGELPDRPAIEMYFHTTVDGSLAAHPDARGLHSAALFVQWVPNRLAGGVQWADREEEYVRHLLGILDEFAPGSSDLVVDSFALTPPKIEQHFGMTSGHIHHIDNSFGFDQRMPYKLAIPGLYSCSAGTHPGGSVIGCGGHNAARQVVQDLDLIPWW